MANEIYTRIQLKYDSYANWTGKNPTLLAGEVAIAKLVSDVTIPEDTNKNAPVLFKVGPGAFNSLPWVSGLAADVYAWAKKETPDWTDFPALPITIVDSETGKFVTDFEYSENKLTIHRSDVAWGDIQGKPDVKIRQTPVVDPTVNGKALEFIDTIAQNANGEITATKKAVNLDDYALKSDIPTELGVMSVKATGDDEITMTPATAENGDVTVTATHATHAAGTAKSASTATISGYEGTGSIKIPKIVTNAAGHVTEITEETVTITMPAVENTAHTHAVGDGLKQSTDGGINGEVKTELNLKFEELTEDNKLRLVDANTNALVAEFNASEFVEDSYLESVSYSDADGDNILTFVFKLNNGTEKTVDVDLKHLVDVYTADETSITLVTSGDGKLFKVKEAGIETKHIKDGNVTEEKLAEEVTAKLNKQWQPIGDYQPAGDYKTTQDEKNYTGSTVKTVTEVKQDTNGVITEVKFEDITFPESPKASGTAQIASVDGDGVVTIKGGAALAENHTLNNSDASDVVLHKMATTGSIYDVKEGVAVSTADDDAGQKYLIFNCGSATTVI